MRLFARAAFAAVVAFACLPAVAFAAGGGITQPAPFAETLPAKAGQCVSADSVKADLIDAVNQAGGEMAVFSDAERAQAFADAWRSIARLPSVKVSSTLLWVQSAVIVAEIDDKGCLLTVSTLSYKEFETVLKAMPKKQSEASPGGMVAPAGMPFLLPFGALAI